MFLCSIHPPWGEAISQAHYIKPVFKSIYSGNIFLFNLRFINIPVDFNKIKKNTQNEDKACRVRVRTSEPLTLFLLRFARWDTLLTFLRHGGPCPAAVRPLARPALAEALLWKPGSQSRCRTGNSPSPTSLLRRRQPEDAVARTEPGESPVTLTRRGLALAVTYRRLSKPLR